MTARVGDHLDDDFDADVPCSGLGSASTLGEGAPRLYQGTTIGFAVDAPQLIAAASPAPAQPDSTTQETQP